MLSSGTSRSFHFSFITPSRIPYTTGMSTVICDFSIFMANSRNLRGSELHDLRQFAEQLIVTAYSTQPPAPQTVPRHIDGETYQVFLSVEITDTGRNAHIMIFRIGIDEFEAYTRRAHPRVS